MASGGSLHRPFCGSVLQLAANGRDVLNSIIGSWRCVLPPSQFGGAPAVTNIKPVANFQIGVSPGPADGI
jgi:hypothetical protein